ALRPAVPNRTTAITKNAGVLRIIGCCEPRIGLGEGIGITIRFRLRALLIRTRAGSEFILLQNIVRKQVARNASFAGHASGATSDYSSGSSSEGTVWRAFFSVDVSFPPASARSGRPPPEPPTCFASACISL